MAPPKRKGGRTIPATKDDVATTASARVTAKGTGAKAAPAATDDGDHPPSSTRYTPPASRQAKMDMPSPVWVPILMFGLLGLGALVIVLNYLGVLPGDTDNKYLAVGLVMILGGIVTATQYR